LTRRPRARHRNAGEDGSARNGWYDCRNAHGQGGHGCARPDSYTQFWATYSTAGGTRFAPDFRASQGTSNAKDTHSSFDVGDYTQVAFQSGLFYPAWSDNSDSTGTNPDGKLHQVDPYMARVLIPGQARLSGPRCIARSRSPAGIVFTWDRPGRPSAQRGRIRDLGVRDGTVVIRESSSQS
jgi:hypothetical protein